MRPRPVRVERQINETAMILGSAPSVESLRGTEWDEHGGWCGTPCVSGPVTIAGGPGPPILSGTRPAPTRSRVTVHGMSTPVTSTRSSESVRTLARLALQAWGRSDLRWSQLQDCLRTLGVEREEADELAEELGL